MVKLRPVLILFLWLNGAMLPARGQDTLLLFHPTAYNLELFQTLVQDGIIRLDGIHILGVYHEKEEYDYAMAEAYLELHPESPMSLRAIRGPLNPGNVFKENACTSQFKDLFKNSLGALFMGGPDIPPALYHEPVHLLTSVTDPYRHYCEASYLFHLLGGSQDPSWEPCMEEKASYLISGICLGMQTLNVATGGTLVQDIPTELYGTWTADEILSFPADQMHRNYMDLVNTGCETPTSYHFHHIHLEKGAFLTKGIHFNHRKEPLVLSSHHQALEKLGKGWVVAATSMDGRIVESIEHERYPHVFGVQFHPEKPGLYDPSIEHPRGCNSTINFQEAIRDTDSYTFHLAYWKYLEEILQGIRGLQVITRSR